MFRPISHSAHFCLINASSCRNKTFSQISRVKHKSEIHHFARNASDVPSQKEIHLGTHQFVWAFDSLLVSGCFFSLFQTAHFALGFLERDLNRCQTLSSHHGRSLQKVGCVGWSKTDHWRKARNVFNWCLFFWAHAVERSKSTQILCICVLPRAFCGRKCVKSWRNSVVQVLWESAYRMLHSLNVDASENRQH